MFIHPGTARVFTDHSAIRHALANVIFPDAITADMLEYHGIVEVAHTDPPVLAGQVAELGDPELVDGQWRTTWIMRPETPEEVAAKVAESVPMLNLQLILIEDGKLTSVETILNGMEGDDGARARAYWLKALTARRDNYLVAQLWPAIGYDEAGFNEAWARAAALNP